MLNEKLKELRENVELSQADVADLMFCSRSLIAKWEQGRANPSDSDLKSLSDIYKCSYEELLNETKNNDISSFSFTIKSVFKYYSYSFSYLFFPYIFSLILIYLLFCAIGVVLGLSSNGNNAMECFIVIWIVIIALMPLLVFVAYKTKKRSQGGVGLPLTILDHKELETVSINHNENTIFINIKREFNGIRNSYTEMKINFVEEKRKYFIVGESRFHSAILPKDKTPIEIQEKIRKINR